MLRSVVGQVVDQLHVCSSEAEGYAPVAADPNRPVPLKSALEWMEPERGQAQFTRSGRGVQGRENPRQLGTMSRLDASRGPGEREALMVIVAEIVRGQQPPDEASVRRVACRCSPSKTEFPQLNSNP